MSKDKPVNREKKKGSNGNNSVPGCTSNGGENGPISGGNGSEQGSVGIKSEPMERERDRTDEEVKEEPAPEHNAPEQVEHNEENLSSDSKPPELNLTESKIEENQLDNPVCKSLKTEDGANSEPDFGNEVGGCEGVLGLALVQDGVQPLASNIINKQPATMEAQYMQQQKVGGCEGVLGLALVQDGVQPLASNIINKQPATMEAQYMQQQKVGGCEGVLGLALVQDGVQPLASNIINKQPATMEAQYMQQQSQIFVFSTALANKSAESVLQGQFSSIIAYHCAQPRTKKFLEKHPLKMTQFNRQNPAQWLNNLAQIKQKNAPGGIKCQGMGRGLKNNMMMDVGLGISNRMPLWNQGNSMGGNGGSNMGLGPQMKPEPPSMMPSSPGSNILQGGVMPSLSEFSDDGISLGPHHSLAGVKVPDENLTPQQRQHREEQLATLRKMQQMLFPEHHSPGSGDNAASDLDQVMPDAAELMLNHKNQPVVSQADWQKLQMQFYDERKKKTGNPAQIGGSQNNGRSQGPPPPYHQTTRSASVPVAVPSPTPGSPNNTTSNLSLPSPRTCSSLNSPAESKRHPPGPSPPIDSPGATRSINLSNPGTPVSTHLSPKKEKQNGSNSVVGEFSPTSNISAPTSQHSPVDSLFCRSHQSLSQQKVTQPPSNSTPTSKEPNLMPVPSPQQIQYLNTFEGQELTIQKQPNTSLKETNIISPSLPQKSVDGVLAGGSNSELNSKLSGRTTPLTPVSMELAVSRYTTSPQPTPEKVTARNPSDQRFCPSPSPQIQDPIATSRFNMIPSSPVISNSYMQQQQPKSGPHFIDIPSSNKSCVGDNIKDPAGGNYPCIGPDNIPLNPNGMTRISVGNGNKVPHFDPITSLAQMSQQLTNNVGSSPVNQSGGMVGPSSGMHPGMMPFNSGGSNTVHMMSMNEMGVCPGPSQDMGSPGVRSGNPQMATHPHTFSPGSVGNGAPVNRMPCPSVSPKPNIIQGVYNGPPGPRLVSRAPVPNSYNGANIQVKPSAPNTIQYLPTRPQQGAAGPRGPPSLDFLHRFSNPLSNLDAKVPTHNLQYFPNYQQISSGGDMLGNINCGNMGQGPGNVVMRGTLRGGSGGMMRVGVQNLPNMPGFSGNEQMFPNPGGSSCQMFVPSSKGSPLGMGGMAPEASQPLPPSMGQANNFKNSSFIGPTTADPNYAQQFHNFQQQLYATNTRSQLGNPAMGTNQQFFVPK